MSKSKSATAPVYKSTARRTYTPAPERPSTYWELPFNFFPRRGGNYKTISHWRVPPTDDYGLSCRTGREYAAHFIQYLKDNPSSVGANFLGHIAKDIDFSDESGTKGYWIGFFGHLERFIYAAARDVNVFDDADKRNARQLKLEAERKEVEEECEGETA